MSTKTVIKCTYPDPETGEHETKPYHTMGSDGVCILCGFDVTLIIWRLSDADSNNKYTVYCWPDGQVFEIAKGLTKNVAVHIVNLQKEKMKC